MIEIALKERGPPELVPYSVWREASLEEPMRILAARGIVRLTRTAAAVLVTPGHHVGEMVLPLARFRIEPKSAGLLDAMELLALRSRVKTARNYQTASRAVIGDDKNPAADFLRALVVCIGEGIPWKYSVHTEVTSFPRGRIQFAQTLRNLASRGVRHRVVASRPIRLQEEEFIRVVQLAIECLPGTPGANPKLLTDVDLLSGTLDRTQPFPSLEAALETAHAVLDTVNPSFSPAAWILIRRSIDVITRQYARASSFEHVPSGVARFQDLEDLWEKCTHHLVGRWLDTSRTPGSAELHSLRGLRIRLFEDGGPELDPDIVVRHGKRLSFVFDAKYKSLDAGASSAAVDLYQLTAYVRRLSAKAGVLVHFAYEKEQIVHVGTTPEGSPVLAVSVSPELLLSEGENALARLLDAHTTVGKRLKQRLADCLSHQGRDRVPDLSSDILLRPEEDEVVREGL